MAQSRKANIGLVEENQRLRAQVAQLQDRLDHLAEHGEAAKAMQQSDAFHKLVMSVVADTVLMADDAGRLTYVSPNCHFIFGHSAVDVMKQGRICFLLPGDLFDPDLLEQRGEIANIECQIRDAVGRARNLLVTVRQIDGQFGTILYTCRDVTERVKIELDYELIDLTLERRVEERTRELREGHERYRRLVEGLRDEYLFYAANQDGTITYVSPSVHNILGYTPDEVIGRNWREFFDSNDPTLEKLEKLEQMRFAGIPMQPYSASIPRADGSMRILEFRDAPLRDTSGRVIANEGIGKDVTVKHEAEQALQRAHDQLEHRVRERTAELTAKNEQLRDSEQRYRSVVDDHPEFIIRWRDDGLLTFVNESYCHHRQQSREELLGSSFMPAIVEEEKELLRQKLANVSLDIPVVAHEHRVIDPEGRTIWERWTHRGLFNQQGNLVEFQSVGCDFTEQRKHELHAQERVMALAKLRTLSDREHDVLSLVVAGNANKIIARKLALSIKTIEKHRSSLMKKLHVRSVPELVRLALQAEDSVDSQSM
jgi:PAS domain S-box-containing protein